MGNTAIFLVVVLVCSYFFNTYWPFIFIGIVVGVVGSLVFIGQVVGFLSQEKWTPYSLLFGLDYVAEKGTPLKAWIDSPQDWLGVHTIMETLPLALSLLLLGLFLGWIYIRN